MRKTIVLGAILIALQIPLLAYVFLQQRTWGGVDRDGANGVAAASDGSVYVTGSTRSFGAGGDDAFLLKYSAGGSLLWQRTYGTAPDELNSGGEAGVAVAVAPDGSGVVMLGNDRDGKIFLAKFNPNGTLLWDLTWGVPNSEAAGAIAISPTNGTIYVTGTTFGPDDAFLLSFTPGGALNWQRTWGGAFFDAGRGVAVATDGGIYISGETIFSANAAFLVKFAANGSVIWQREWGVIGKAGPGRRRHDGQQRRRRAQRRGLRGGRDHGHRLRREPRGRALRRERELRLATDRRPGIGLASDVAVGPEGNVHVAGNVLTDGGDSGANAFVWTLLATARGTTPEYGEGTIRSSSSAPRRSPRRRTAQSPRSARPVRLPMRSIADRRTRRRWTRSST